MEKDKTHYVAIEDKGNNVLFVHYEYTDLDLMIRQVEEYEAISGKKLIITMEVKRK